MSDKTGWGGTQPADRTGPVMLALSTFRQSDKAVELALKKAKAIGRLIVVNVVDVNLARYLVGSDVSLFPELKDSCEKEILQEHEQEGRKRTAAIAERASKAGIAAEVHVEVGRFAIVCMRWVQESRPSVIITTRSKRPEWVRRFFGSPVDELIRQAGCPVVTV